MRRLLPFFYVLISVIAPLAASSQSDNIGLPVIFVHGFCDSADSFLPIELAIMRSLQKQYPLSYPHTKSEEYVTFFDGTHVNFQNPKTETANYEEPPKSTRFFILALDDPGKSAYESFDPYSVMLQPISVHGDELAHIIWEIKKITKAPRVIVIGHSMGGLVARTYIESVATSLKMKGPDAYYNDIASLVTLDTPHGGTDWAKYSSYISPWYQCAAKDSDDKQEMIPNSPFLSALNWSDPDSKASELPPSLTVYSIASTWTHPLDPDYPTIIPNTDFVVSGKHQDLESNLQDSTQHSKSSLIALPNQFAEPFPAQDRTHICGKNDILHLLECVGYAAQTTQWIEGAVSSGAIMSNKILITAPAAIVAGTTIPLSVKSPKDPLIWSLLEGEEAGSVNTETGSYTAPDTPGTYHAVVIDQVHFLQYGLVDLNVIADPAKPAISDWSVSPTSLTVGATVKISYTASDNGGSGLLRGELWRAPDSNGKPGTWEEEGKPLPLSGDGPAKVLFKDVPSTAGKYWYGTHLFAASGNQTNEPTPIQVTVTQSAPVVTIPVGTNPVAVAVNSVTNRIYVANANSNNVTVIDGDTNATTTVDVGTYPVAIAVNAITNRVYVVNFFSNSTTVIDGSTNKASTITGTGYSGFDWGAVAVNPVTDKIYVTYSAPGGSVGTVTVINGATEGTTTVTPGQNPIAVAVNPKTDKIYVPNIWSNNVTVIDGTTNETTTVNAGACPLAVATNSVTNLIYVANEGCGAWSPGSVTVIDGATNSTTTINNGQDSVAVAVNSKTNRLYVANSNGTVSVFDGNGPAYSTIDVGTSPTAISVATDANKVYVANMGSDSVTVIDGATNTATTKKVGTAPSAIAVNPSTGAVYVVNSGSDNVTILRPN